MTLKEQLEGSVFIETARSLIERARTARMPQERDAALTEAARLLDTPECESLPKDEQSDLFMRYAEALYPVV